MAVARGVAVIRFVQASGDIVPDGAVTAGGLNLSCNAWTFGDRRCEVNSFWLGDPDCSFYQVCGLGQPRIGTNLSTSGFRT